METGYDSHRQKGSNTNFDEHLVADSRPGGFCWGAINRHGLSVTGELQSEFLLHELFDHLQKRTAKKKNGF